MYLNNSYYPRKLYQTGTFIFKVQAVTCWYFLSSALIGTGIS